MRTARRGRRADRATTHASSKPVRRARPGEVGFARFDTETDYNLFRQRSRLVVIPFGPRVPRSRRPARAAFGSFARATRNGNLLVPVFCDRVCTVRGTSAGRDGLLLTDSQAHRVAHRLESFTVAYLRVPLSAGRTRTEVRLRATDDAAHRSSARAVFTRSTRPGLWCFVGASRC